MVRKKVKAKDLKKQRWAGIVAAILALGMIVSLVGAYIGQAVGGGGAVFPDQQVEPEPEDYLAYYESEVERLETYLEENGAGEAVLLELAENYRYLTIVHQVFFDDQEAVGQYQEKLISTYAALVNLEPANPQYRLELAYLYLEGQEDIQLINEEVSVLQDLLRENPNPMYHLSMIQLLGSIDEDEVMREEILWVEDYLEERIAGSMADNEERFFYAVLLGEYLEDAAAAREILEYILQQESEESRIYQNALTYLDYFSADNNS